MLAILTAPLTVISLVLYLLVVYISGLLLIRSIFSLSVVFERLVDIICETMAESVDGVDANGDSKYIDSVDQDDPEYIKEMQRPPDIKEDLQAMEARQRVSVILNSQGNLVFSGNNNRNHDMT